jgi:hypothetical protein
MICYNTVSDSLLQLVKRITDDLSFQKFRLGGGTALALQIGHRKSIDADFISAEAFDNEAIARRLEETFSTVKDIHRGTHGVFCRLNDIKVDFLTWCRPFIRNAVTEDGLRLLHVEEIAAMKFFAITRRGEKKDYVDIAALLKLYSLDQLMNFYSERHPENDAATAARFLVSYSDIESQPMPAMLNEMSWEDCKAVLQQSVKNYLKS